MDDAPNDSVVLQVVYGNHARIGSEGGRLIWQDGERYVSLEVPRGALNNPTDLTIQRSSSPQISGAVSPEYDIGPSGTVFEIDAKITIQYLSSDVEGHLIPGLVIATKHQGQPTMLVLGAKTSQEVIGLTRHLSPFAIVADPTAFSILSKQLGDKFSTAHFSVATSRPVLLSSMVVSPVHVTYMMQHVDGQSTEPIDITLEGLVPQTTLYLVDSASGEKTLLESNQEGQITYQQTIRGLHVVRLQKNHGTITISVPDGGECIAPMGLWTENTKTCTLKQDVFENIVFDGEGITLKCRDAQTGEHTIDTRALSLPTLDIVHNNVQIIDCNIKSQGPAIHIRGAIRPDFGDDIIVPVSGVRILNNKITTDTLTTAIHAQLAENIEITDNTINSATGIALDSTSSSRVARNAITSSLSIAVFGDNATDNVLANNEITTHPFSDIPSPLPGAVRFNDGFLLLPGAERTNVNLNTLSYTTDEDAALIASRGIFSFGQSRDCLDNLDCCPNSGSICEFLPNATVGSCTSACTDDPLDSIFRANTIRRYSAGIMLFNGTIDAEVFFNTFTGNNLALQVVPFGGMDNSALHIFLNDIFGNGDPDSGNPNLQVDVPEIVNLFKLYRGQWVGNYWGYQCDSDFYFFRHRESQGLDSHPFGVKVASLHLNEAVIPAPGGCDTLNLSDECRALTAAPEHVGGPCDTDGDGLLDHEEIEGVHIPLPTGGTAYVDYPLLGANPFVKDVFVEIDYVDTTTLPTPDAPVLRTDTSPPRDSWKAGTKPTIAEFLPVIEAFANHGITLHLDLGDIGKGTRFDLSSLNTGSPNVITPPVDLIGVDDPRPTVIDRSFGGGISFRHIVENPDTLENDDDIRSEFMHFARRHGFRYAVYGVGSAFSDDYKYDIKTTSNIPRLSTFFEISVIKHDANTLGRFEYENGGVGEIESSIGQPADRFVFSYGTRSGNNKYTLHGISSLAVNKDGTDNPSGIDFDHIGNQRVIILSPRGGVAFKLTDMNSRFSNPNPSCVPSSEPCLQNSECCSFHCKIDEPSGSMRCGNFAVTSPGNVFTITFGLPRIQQSHTTAELERASIFMHELGHNFGLHHGGFEEKPDHKPNYPSVMNPLFSKGIRAPFQTFGVRLDYSDGSRPALDVNSAREADILDENNVYQFTFTCPSSPTCPEQGSSINMSNMPTDWTCDCDTNDICGVGGAECIIDETRIFTDPDLGDIEIATVLLDFDDWSNLDFRGGVAGLAPADESQEEVKDELSFSSYEEWGPLSEPLPIWIDVKPGNLQNPVNLKSKGVVPVALLSGIDYLASDLIEENSVRFGANGIEARPQHCETEDADQDGRPDLICHFEMQETGFDYNSTIAYTRAKTFRNVDLVGEDAIRIVP